MWLAIVAGRKPWRTLVRGVFRVPLALLKFADGLLLGRRNTSAEQAAYSVFYVGRKPVRHDHVEQHELLYERLVEKKV